MSVQRKAARLIAVIILAASAAAAAPSPDTRPEPAPPETTAAQTRLAQAPRPPGCCRTCSAGKACGDSCIARDKTCNKGPGCACNADGSPPGRIALPGMPAEPQLFTPIEEGWAAN